MSGRSHILSLENISRNGPRNYRSLGFPGFPVELGGVDELHAPFLTERRTRGSVLCCVAGNSASPDFLLNLVALTNFMRLSLLKGAHAALSCAAWQEIRVRSG
jgi:hypothetical protein